VNEPRYPIYIPSKGRADTCLTAEMFKRDGVAFYLVIEPQERAAYAERYGDAALLVLPFSNRGSVIPTRNWIKAHAVAAGYERHWQLDDNIRMARRWYGGKRIPCSSGVALAVCEDFTDRYSNVALAGLNYTMFAHQSGKQPADPFWLNVHVYSCTLVLNSIPYEWRGRYNEDTDICLQALAGGWCTILLNAFMVDKVRTMTMRGGNTSALYLGDGRLRMARALERLWPGVVTTERRWQRPQHVVKDQWRKFDTLLRLKPDVDLSKIEPNEYGMRLKQVEPVVKSERLRRLLEELSR
jgi:hypothetical protein